MTIRSADPNVRGPVVVCAGFQTLRSVDVRLLEEAARIGKVHVRLWTDELIESAAGRKPDFPEAERRFFLENIRYVEDVSLVSSPQEATQPIGGVRPGAIVAADDDATDATRRTCEKAGIPYVELGSDQLRHFPASVEGAAHIEPGAASSDLPRVIVTGCFDWLHSGHVEFFREAAALGELYVVVGSDRNVRLLKGDGHPLHKQDERRFMVQAVRQVHQALISTGSGWMDAEPEIASIMPRMYVVNEDGDQPEKRDFCHARGLEYVVLKRQPHPGLPRRTSTQLRGF